MTSVPPLIARLLGDETYYGNDGPTWPNAPTSADARSARKSYIKRLRRFSAAFPEAKQLANVLARCRRRRRCQSGACPECCRAFQRWFVSEITALITDTASNSLSSISVIFSKHRTPKKRLQVLTTAGMMRSMSETIRRADGLAWLVGGIDLSLNDDTKKRIPVAWQPQLYVIAMATVRRSRTCCAPNLSLA